jgi:methylenetetrahydrofolate reductase (NADPH)
MDLGKKLDNGEFVTLAEFTPPKGTDVSAMIENAARIQGYVDALVIPDLSGAIMRMSALGGAILLQGQGIPTALEMNCRDRNRLALQADLLAASAHGITNIIVASGDDLKTGDHPEAKAVFDADVLVLLETIRSMQQGKDMAGRELQGIPKFLVGATTNATTKGKELKAEVEAVKKKTERGAAYFLSPPLFDISSIQPFLELIAGENIKIIPKVLLLKSVGMARYIDAHNDLIEIPRSLIERIEDADDIPRELIHIATEMIATLKREGFSGVLLSTAGWERRLPEILGVYGAAQPATRTGG